MSYGNYAQEYRKNAVIGASPVQLVVMLYDGALKFMEQGKVSMAARDIQKQNHYIQKAQRIVMELMSSLDMVKGGEIAKNLLALYTYVLEELVSANIEDRSECLDRAMRTLTELRESWVEVEKITRAGVQEVPLAA